MSERVTVTRWPGGPPPAENALDRRLTREGFEPQWWSNAPSDTYEPHEHDYQKVLYCAAGSITFLLPRTGEALEIRPGDRLEIPPHTLHAAEVGPAGVRCVEGHRAETRKEE